MTTYGTMVINHTTRLNIHRIHLADGRLYITASDRIGNMALPARSNVHHRIEAPDGTLIGEFTTLWRDQTDVVNGRLTVELPIHLAEIDT